MVNRLLQNEMFKSVSFDTVVSNEYNHERINQIDVRVVTEIDDIV